jgi:hypothetical protein
MAKVVINLAFELSLFLLRSDFFFLHFVKTDDIGPTALLSLRRKLYYGILSPLKVHCIGRV